MRVFKKVLTLFMVITIIAGTAVIGTVTSGAAATGTGLCEWAMRAYHEGWSYVWGGDSIGAVDCSGMITSYCGGNRTSMLADAQANGRDWGYVSDGIPNVHGLGLSRPNHVGVYVGGGMEIDARGDDYGICYQEVGSRWDCWFKLTAITYPTDGWQSYNGDYYYYENGEYLADTSRTIDGVTYYFDYSGASSTTPADTTAAAETTAQEEAADNDTDTDTAPAEENDADAPLKRGSTGEQVEALQQRLTELGYYDGAVDGDFGAMTETAFKRFQKEAGLYEDGIAGDDAQLLYAEDAPSLKADLAAVGSPDPGEAADDSAYTDDNSDSDTADTQETPEDTADTDSVSDDTADTDNSAESGELRYAKGDYSDTVATLQQQLIQLGYLEGDADGAFGAMTEAAVKDFQTANHQEATGVIDQATYDALFSASAVRKSGTDAASVEPTASKAENVAATTATSAAVELDNAALSQKAAEAVSSTVSANRASATGNFEFIIWLGVMIVVMIITLIIVYVVEKKKARDRAKAGRKFQ